MSRRKDFEDFFDECDRNKDGFLNKAELKDVLGKFGYIPDNAHFEKMFSSADTSKDGLISKQEFLVAMGQTSDEDHNLATMRRVFESFDKDHNGYIDKHELQKVMEELGRHLPSDQIEKMIGLMDQDGDGQIDYNEFVKHFSA